MKGGNGSIIASISSRSLRRSIASIIILNLGVGFIQQFCRAPEVTSGAEFDELQRIKQKLGAAINPQLLQRHRIDIRLVKSDVINAWESDLSPTDSIVCIPLAMAQFMGGAEGELAFIVSHEIGHALDNECKTEEGRLRVATSRGSLGALLGGLLGGQQGAAAASTISQQRGCESRAYEIGFNIFTAAGYNPYDAAGGFGRLEMYNGDTSTGILARLNALGSDHPITPDRVKRMRILLINYAQGQ